LYKIQGEGNDIPVLLVKGTPLIQRGYI
jgi:hypothetical protein